MGQSDAEGDLRFVGRGFCGNGGCVEAARMPDGQVALRSSLATEALPLIVTGAEWAGFLEAVKAAQFDVI